MSGKNGSESRTVSAAALARARTFTSTGTPVIPTDQARQRLADSMRKLGADESTIQELVGLS